MKKPLILLASLLCTSLGWSDNQAVNLALNKPATQSTTASNAYARRAVDGNTNGIYSAGSTTHTQKRKHSWWQVDLEKQSSIENMVIHNRKDCCQDRLRSFWVFASNKPIYTHSLDDLIDDPDLFKYQYDGSNFLQHTIPVASNGYKESYRYIRVQSTQRLPLSIAEFQVFPKKPSAPFEPLDVMDPETLAQFDVGHIPVTASVSPDGSATANIPISIPAAPQNAKPNLSINYSSHIYNGNMGVGWHLNVASAISRCDSNDREDRDTVSNKELCLDGEKIHLYGSSNWGRIETYHTPAKRHQKIIKEEDYFTVTDQKGNLSVYGYHRDNRTANAYDNDQEWRLSHTVDVHDNIVFYQYNEYGQLDSIKYNIHRSNRDTHYSFVDFSYNNNQQLKQVSVYNKQQLVSHHLFTYNSNKLLTQIKQCSSSRENGCIPPVTLNWETIRLDTNGDGRTSTLYQLSRITNQLNVNTSFEYSKLSDSSVYQHEPAENSEQVAVEGNHSVVKSLYREDGLNGVRQENYFYSGLKFDARGSGSLGFNTVKTHDIASNTTTVTTYYQSYALRGIAKSVAVYLGDEHSGKKLQDIQHQFEVISTSSYLKDGVYIPYLGDHEQYFTYLKKSYTAKYDHQGNVLFARLTENEYPHGNNQSTGRIRINSTNYPGFEADIGNALLSRTKTIHLDYDLNDPLNFSGFDTSRWGLEEEISYTYKRNWNGYIGKIDTLSYVATINGDQSTRKTKTTKYMYDERTGQVNQEITEPGNQGIVHAYQYNHRGQITRSERYAEGQRCNNNRTCRYNTNDYHEDGTLFQKRNSLNHQWRITETNHLNQPVVLVDANNIKETRRYDSYGRIKSINKAGTQRTKTYDWCFNSGNCQSGEIYFEKMSIEGQVDNWVFFDMHHREVRRAVSGFDGRLIQVKEEFDALGRLTQKSNPFYEGDIPVWQTYQYDDLNRVHKTFIDNTLIETNEYTGHSLTTTNAKDQQTTLEYNVLGKPVRVIDAMNLTVSHEYDALGYITKTVHPSGVSTFGYDNHHRVVWADEPTAGRRENHFDTFGNRFLNTQQDGTKTCTAIDPLNRKVKRIYGYTGSLAQAKNNCSGNGSFTSTWKYDQSFKGRVSEATSSQGVTQRYVYNNLGQQTQHTQIVGNESIDLNYQYDNFGRMKSIHYPGNVNIEYVYNTHGYLKQVTNMDSGFVYSQNNSFDAAGNVLEKQYFNGLRQTQSFSSDRNWLVEKEITGGNFIESIKMSMDYDAIGNLLMRQIDTKQRSTAPEPAIETYNYDALNRMTDYEHIVYQPGKSYRQNFTYDNAGNLFRDYKNYSDNSKSSDTYFLPKKYLSTHYSGFESCVSSTGAPDALAFTHIQRSSGQETFNSHCYDDRGNMTRNGQQELSFSAFNKPLNISLNSNQVNYVYGPYLEKVLVNDNYDGRLTKTLYFGSHSKETQPDGSNSYILQVANDVVVRVSSRTSAYVSMKDQLGTTLINFYESADGSMSQSFDPWGNNRLSNIGLTNAILGGFTGHRKGDSLPLVHMGGRVYSPELKRFLTIDPFVQQINNGQNYNRYSYVLNNPTAYTDPSGYKFFHKAGHGLKKFGNAVRQNLPHSTAGWVMFSVGLAVAPGFVLTEMAIQGAACTSSAKSCQTTGRVLMGVNGAIEIVGATVAAGAVCVTSAGVLCAPAAALATIAVAHGVDSLYAASSGNTMFETKGLEDAGMSQQDAELTVQAVDLGANLALAGLGSISEAVGTSMTGESASSDGFAFSEVAGGEPTVEGSASNNVGYELPALPDRFEGEPEYDSPNARQIYHLARFYEKGSAVLYSGKDYQLFMNEAGAVDEGYSVMHFDELDTWSPEVNRALIDGQLARDADFVSASPVNDASLANVKDDRIRVFGVERDQIARAGYESNGTEGIIGEPGY